MSSPSSWILMAPRSNCGFRFILHTSATTHLPTKKKIRLDDDENASNHQAGPRTCMSEKANIASPPTNLQHPPVPFSAPHTHSGCQLRPPPARCPFTSHSIVRPSSAYSSAIAILRSTETSMQPALTLTHTHTLPSPTPRGLGIPHFIKKSHCAISSKSAARCLTKLQISESRRAVDSSAYSRTPRNSPAAIFNAIDMVCQERTTSRHNHELHQRCRLLATRHRSAPRI